MAANAIPALIQLLTLPFFPDSPRYLLIDKKDKEGCIKGKETGHKAFVLLAVSAFWLCVTNGCSVHICEHSRSSVTLMAAANINRETVIMALWGVKRENSLAVDLFLIIEIVFPYLCFGVCSRTVPLARGNLGKD